MFDDTAVVILAAGQGTRMKSRMAKVLHRAGGKPLVRQAIDTAREIAPPERIFVVVGYQADRVRAEVEATGARVIHQTEQLGTGHAVMCGEAELAGLGGRLIVFVGDCPLIRAATLAELAEMQESSGSAATVITTKVEDPTGYGRIIRGFDDGVEAIVEQKAATPEQLGVREINSGIFCFDSASLWKHIHEIRPDNPAHEYYLTDMVSILKRAGKRVTALKVADASELLGINNRIELAAADRILRARKLRQLMLDGVTIEQPETVTVDASVKVGMDTVIGPFAQITGDTVIGENCRIGASSIIDNSVLDEGVEVFPFSFVVSSKLDARAQVGPYARLRPGAHLEEGAHVGNFVELKNTRLGRGVEIDASGLSGRLDHREKGQRRRGHHHVQLRRKQEVSDGDRRWRFRRQQFDFDCSGGDRGKRLYRGGKRDQPEGAGEGAGARAIPAGEQGRLARAEVSLANG